MPPTDAERIARLEAQQQEGERVHQALFDRLDDQQEQLDTICKDVSEIKGTIRQYRGFIGGVIFTVSALGAAIGAVATAFWKKIAG